MFFKKRTRDSRLESPLKTRGTIGAQIDIRYLQVLDFVTR
jgi:hypothetical protein